MVLAAALLVLLQDDASSFAPDQRLTAAYYYPGPDAKPAAEFLEMGKAGVEIALVSFPGDAASLDPLIAALDSHTHGADTRLLRRAVDHRL